MIKIILGIIVVIFFLGVSSFLNYDDRIINTILKQKDFNYDWLDKNIFELQENEFKKLVKEKYVYSKEYDCKYWAYLYYNYYNKKEYQVDYIYSFRYRHILVSVFYEGGYKIIDGDLIREYKISFIE